MIVYEYGKENKKTMLMFQCAAEPSWTMFPVAEAMGRDYHVFFAAADGNNPEEDSTFISIEKYAEDAVRYIKERGVSVLDAVYGISMGGSAVMRMLAVQAMPVKKAIVDAGITPYPYPYLIRKLILLKDFLMVRLGTKHIGLAKMVMPMKRWTPEGVDPEEHYKKIFDFLASKRFSNKTIRNIFWSANNWVCPEPVPIIETEIEYWYGEEERKARKGDIAWTLKHFPQTKLVKMNGFDHAELVLVHPKEFYEEATRFLKNEN